MRVINFAVNNYRGICGGLDKNKIDFEGSNTIFIFGQNNAGKSSFLKAFKVFYDDETLESDDFYGRNCSVPIEMVLEIELNEEEKESLNNLGKKKTNADEKYFFGKDKNRLRFKKEWTSANSDSNNLTYNESSGIFEDVGFAGIGEHNFFKPLLPKPIFIKAMPSEDDLETVVNDILASKVKEVLKGKEEDEYKKAEEIIRSLQRKVYEREDVSKYKDEVNRNFSSLFPNIQIAISEKDPETVIKSIDKKFTVNFEHLGTDGKRNQDMPLSFANIGHGAIRMAIFSLFLMRDFTGEENSKKFIVLFEEPELFLHPKLTKQVRKLIYEVTDDKKPFQLLCASHSPNMVDITRPKTSLVRMVKGNKSTRLFQVDEKILLDEKNHVKQELYEALRFNPFVCESFYADEVVLVEGDTEAVILRAYLQSNETEKDIFILNCGTVNNIPFFQKIFTLFNIRHHVICDCDSNPPESQDEKLNPVMNKGIQGSIYKSLESSYSAPELKPGLLRVHDTNFEDAHRKITAEDLCFTSTDSDIKRDGKPYCANEYWNNVLAKNLDHKSINEVPIIKFIREIINS